MSKGNGWFVFDTTEWDLFTKHFRRVKFFRKEMEQLASDLAKFLLENLNRITPVKTGKLKMAWTKESEIVVEPKKNGYQVTLVNTCPYANYVNNGHYSYNQFNVGEEPYVVHNRTVPYDEKFGGDYPSDDTYVFGRFFVENAILQSKETDALEQIIMNALLEWWDWC